MMDFNIVGLDLAKRVFQVHGATADGEVVVRKKLSRGQVLAYFADMPPCVVASNCIFHDVGAAHF